MAASRSAEQAGNETAQSGQGGGTPGAGETRGQGGTPGAGEPAAAWPQYAGPSHGQGRIAAELGLAGRRQPDPAAQNSAAQNPEAQDTPAGDQAGRHPAAQNQRGPNPAVQNAPGQNRPGQNPAVQNQQGQNQQGQNQGMQGPAGQDPAAQSPAAQSPAAQSPVAQSPAAQTQALRRPLGPVQAGEDDDQTQVFGAGLAAGQARTPGHGPVPGRAPGGQGAFGPGAQAAAPVGGPAAMRAEQRREQAFAGSALRPAGQGHLPPPGDGPPPYSGDRPYGSPRGHGGGGPHEPDEPRRGRRPALLVGGGLGVLLVAAYVALIFLASGKVPGGTTVAGVDIGGLDRAAAEQRLNKVLTDRAGEPLEVVVGDQERTIRPDKAGLGVDIEATVDEAYVGRTLNPVALFGALGGGDPIDPVGEVDEAKLDKALGALAKDTDRKAREGRIAFKNGEVQAVMPVAGQTLDVGAAGDALREAFLELRPDERFELPVTKVAPEVTRAEIEEAVQTFAEPAMSGPVTLEIGDDTVEASPEQLGKALSMAPGGDGLEPRLNGKVLLKALKDDLEGVLTQPQDATIQLVGDQPRVVPGKRGQAVKPKKLEAAVMPALTKSGDERVAEVPTTTKEPDITTKEVEGYGIKEVVGEFSTSFPHSADNYRNINLGRAAELINGTLVEPGGTFSLNDTVGERTEANGFTTGLVIKGGQLKRELGGGVSQVTTTVYNAAFFAGMKDIEHHPHGFYISRYPEGREATVYWGSLDMRWQNTSPYGVYVQAWVDPSTPSSEGRVVVRLWSTKYYEVETETTDRYNIVQPETQYDESDDCVDQPEGVPGFEVDVKRWIYHDGKLVDKEVDHVKYNPEHNVICGPDPNKKG